MSQLSSISHVKNVNGLINGVYLEKPIRLLKVLQ